MSPQALDFLLDASPELRRKLWDTIATICRDPTPRLPNSAQRVPAPPDAGWSGCIVDMTTRHEGRVYYILFRHLSDVNKVGFPLIWAIWGEPLG